MKSKFIPALGVVTILFVFALVWMTNQFLLNDRQSFVETQSRTSVAAVTGVLESELRFLRNWVTVADAASIQKISWEQMVPYIYVARVQLRGAEWAVVEESVRPNLPLGTADRVKIISDFGFQSKDQFSDGYVQISAAIDSLKNPYVGFLLSHQGGHWLFIHQGEAAQSLVEKQMLSRQTMTVVSLSSMVIAHSQKEYIGQKLSSNSILQKIISEQLPQGSGLFKMDKNQSQFAFYQRIPKTNTYVYSALSLSLLTDGRLSLWIQIGAFGFGFLLILISLGAYFKKTEPEVLPPRPGPLPSVAPVVSESTLQKERSESYMKMASALGHEIKVPFIKVLGYGQILLGRSGPPEDKAMIESLLKEAREGKDIVEKLFAFAGEKTLAKTKNQLQIPLQKALKKFEGKWGDKNIKVVKEISTTGEMNLDVELLAKAFENIFENSVDALAKQAQKEIKVKLEENSESFILTVIDTGEGIAKENLGKIFDPFFTTKKASQHMGLGLCAAIGIFKEHQGEIQVLSEPGKGTTLKVTFSKKESSEVISAKPQETAKAPEVKPDPPSINIPHLEIPKFENVSFDSPSEESNENSEGDSKDKNDESEVVDLDQNLDQLLSMPEDAAAPRLDDAVMLPTQPTIVLKEHLNPKASAPVSEQAPAQAAALDLQFLSKDLPATTKSSEVDEFKFSIRRPGKRST
jgi:signal transduction histidine kinase